MLMLTVARQNNTAAASYIDKILSFNETSFILSDMNLTAEQCLLETGSKFVTYKSINPLMSKHEIYTSCHIPEYQRISFTRFRTGSHFLRVETGRWSRLPRESRTCDCNGVDIQDEEHIIMTCSHLNDLRTGYPSLIFEADHFFNNNTEDSAKFIHEALNTIC